MSYNIDFWKTKELVDLRIPVASFFKHDRKDWHPDRIKQDDGTEEFLICECSSLRGTVEDGYLKVAEIELYGEGSGTAMRWILEPALRDSTGRLVASMVWEGGEEINRLIVQDGKVAWEDIEI